MPQTAREPTRAAQTQSTPSARPACAAPTSPPARWRRRRPRSVRTKRRRLRPWPGCVCLGGRCGACESHTRALASHGVCAAKGEAQHTQTQHSPNAGHEPVAELLDFFGHNGLKVRSRLAHVCQDGPHAVQVARGREHVARKLVKLVFQFGGVPGVAFAAQSGSVHRMRACAVHHFLCGEWTRATPPNAPPAKTQHLLRTRVHVVEHRRRLRRIVADVGARVQGRAQQLGEAQSGGLRRGRRF